MAHPSGSRSAGPCPYCGQRYMLTNFMRRYPGESDGHGRLLTNTHLIACFRKRNTAPPVPTNPADGERSVEGDA